VVSPPTFTARFMRNESRVNATFTSEALFTPFAAQTLG
jgi:hypothetical protein